jgi:hypothetical protein
MKNCPNRTPPIGTRDSLVVAAAVLRRQPLPPGVDAVDTDIDDLEVSLAERIPLGLCAAADGPPVAAGSG